SIQAFKQIMRIREAVQAIKPMMLEPEEIQFASPAGASSASSVDLSSSTTGTPTTLESTEEVNSSTTAYSTDPPEWTGDSTVQATIGGEYDGSSGSDTLTFDVKKGGELGGDLIQIYIYDSNNNQIDSLNFKKQDGIGTPYTLSNGLTVTFDEGTFVKNDTFTVEVYDNVPQAVNPDNPFNGTDTTDPNLQSGLEVTSGSFEINGTTIDVAADDTINSVLDKINQSDAGVTATFDAATETVLLTQNTPGSTEDIVLANDTSGFVAAVKLDSAVAVPGEDGTVTEDPNTPLAEVESMSAVQSGSISVNGVSIDIDVNLDSLNDILDRITASEAGVTASYDSSSKQVSLVSNDSESELTIDSGSTSFFPTVNITDATYEATSGSVESQGVEVADVSNLVVESIVEENSEKPWEQNSETAPADALDVKKLSTLVHNMANALNELFDDSALKGSPGSFLDGLRNDIRETVSSWSDSKGSQFETDFGIRFDFEKTGEKADKKVFNFTQTEQKRFETALADPEDSNSILNGLFGQQSNGLFTQLHATLTAAAAAFEKDTSPTGLFLNVSI
ncbi:MAG: flagellin hook IN motif-containing protein, partial [Desulfobacterales bacterium]